MSNSLQVFQFETSTIRTVEIDGVVWFVAKDIALALGYSNTTDAVRTHCRKAKSLKDIGSAVGAPPEITGDGKSQPLDLQSKMIPESDVYRMTLKSTLESAEKFQDWVVEEVLPTIRKTGSYSVIKTPTTYLEALKALVASEEEKQLILDKNKELEHTIEADKPYTDLAKALTGKTTITRRDWVNNMKDDDTGINIKEKELTEFLLSNKYLYRDQFTREIRAYAKYSNYFKLEPELINGSYRNLLKITGQGVLILTPIVLKHFNKVI